jgi:general stress protein YciG
VADNESKSRRTRTGETARGGQAVKAKYGPEFFREIGRKGGQAIKDRGLDYLREIGRLGGEATKARHGAAHYAEIGRKGGQHGKGQPKPGAGRTRRNPS